MNARQSDLKQRRSGKRRIEMTEAESDNDDAFMQSLTRRQRELRAFIIGVTPTLADADDVLQEVNLALWKKRRLYDQSHNFLHWAIGFAAMEIRNVRNRAAKNKLWFNDDLLKLVAEAHQQESTLVEQRRDALSHCVQQLGAVERQFITDFYRKQCSAQELANVSGKPLSTVYKTLTRARRALRGCIERKMASATHAW
jgi:RNA polymerase sigma-70 factor (ECF subfamily)